MFLTDVSLTSIDIKNKTEKKIMIKDVPYTQAFKVKAEDGGY